MNALRRFIRRLAMSVLGYQDDSRVREELALHLELATREYVRAGLPLEEAQWRARLELGAPEPIIEGCRDEQRLRWLEDVGRDLRQALRMLRQRPTFALAAIVTLALGIGANAATFTILNALLLRPLPLPDSGQLEAVYSRFLPSSGLDFPYFELSGPELDDIRTHVDAYARIAGYRIVDRTVSREAHAAARVSTMQVTPDFFAVLGAAPVRGRTFTVQDGARNSACVAVVSEGAVGALDAVGSTIKVDDVPCEVIGVVPALLGSVSAGLNPLGGVRAEHIAAWTPLVADDSVNNRGTHLMVGIARRRDGASATLAQSQLQRLREHWSAAEPAHHAPGHFAVSRPLQQDIVGHHRGAWMLLGAAVLFVLLIVCVNVAALVLSHGDSRRREIAARHALGADRRRLIRQLISESMLLAMAGGLFGVVLAKWLLAALVSLYPQRLPVSQVIAIDVATILCTCALVLVTGIAVGLVPAWQVTGSRLQDVLRTDARTAGSSRRSATARSALVIVQLAVSVILLVGALVLVRGYERLQQVDLGLHADGVLTFGIVIPHTRQDDAAAKRTLEMIGDRLTAVAGAERVGGMSFLPLAAAGPLWAFSREGRIDPAGSATPLSARYITIMPGAFQALRIPLIRGRLLDDRDTAARPLAAVINETAARLYWAGDDPIASSIRFGVRPQESIRIVGVVGDVRSLGPAEPAPPTVYVPLAQSAPLPAMFGRSMEFVIRTAGNPRDLAGSARAAVASADPGLPLVRLRPMEEIAAAASGQPRFTTLTMSVLASVAFLLAALGLYGVLASNVEQRIREIGVRVSLGATRGDVIRLVIGRGMKLAVIGALAGVVAALAVTRVMGGMMPGIPAADLVSYAAVVAVLVVSALVASSIPARRAMRIDPIVALRAD